MATQTCSSSEKPPLQWCKKLVFTDTYVCSLSMKFARWWTVKLMQPVTLHAVPSSALAISSSTRISLLELIAKAKLTAYLLTNFLRPEDSFATYQRLSSLVMTGFRLRILCWIANSTAHRQDWPSPHWLS
jgi:hypothetical protein